MAKIAATAAMTGAESCSHVLIYNANVTAIPVLSIRAPKVKSIPFLHPLDVIILLSLIHLGHYYPLTAVFMQQLPSL